MAKIVDVCTYNGEKDIWDIHYNVLKDHVDEFIVVEFDKTFSGEEKIWTFPDIWEKYPKVKYFYHLDSQYEKYRELAESSPNTVGAEHWKREFMQKESIKDCLTHLDDEDTVFIGDVDEIVDPEITKIEPWFPVKLKLRVYTYYLNNRSTEAFWGTLMAKYGDVKDSCLNHLRQGAKKSDGYGGCHFTSMKDSLRKKLTDSYTQESYATPEVLENLAYNIEQDKDFLGRDFKYEIDESEWPEFLMRNRDNYQHLMK